ncbi:MAG: 4Fe-4S dicluster domain-containing protein [candidate division KSB1 bacterium]|nr:4Fe-4S dicluster domain-containing protein [candidate division KSB1 bacterium]
MTGSPLRVGSTVTMQPQHLQLLLDALIEKGYRVVGPQLQDGAIVYDELASAANLPIGWSDEQEGGRYRLKKRNDQAHFGYTVGPHSWKKFLHPPVLRLWQAKREGKNFQIIPENEAPPKLALVGVRSCELHAIAIQDKIFMNGTYTDPAYKTRREPIFIVAVNCGQAGGTCFCVSMKTGPKVQSGFDLALTEIIDDDSHFFLIEVGTEMGAEMMRKISHQQAKQEEIEKAERIVADTAKQMGRTLDTAEIKNLLYRSYEHPRWDEVAKRCLTCANCTMVCPTCFCTTVEEVTDLTGKHAERWRKWDSCFTMDFSYIHGGSVRPSTKARYRQWLTHKLATWFDQFGTSGCVGCGRCITWCPVAIDLTEEVRAIRASETIDRPTLSAKELSDGNT